MLRFCCSMLLVSAASFAQAPAPAAAPKPANRVIGAVIAKDPSGKQITVKTDNGAVYTIDLADTTSILRVPPGETSLAKAAKINAAEVDSGDRVMVRGDVDETAKRVAAARQVVVMTKEDLAQKHERDRAEWQKRGITGVVSSVDTAAQKIVVASGSGQNLKTTIILGSNTTGYRRYVPGSIRWEDAKPSTLADIKVGDRVRALGDNSADGSEFKAQEIVSGSFTTVAGTIVSVDAAKNEVRLTDVNTKKPITIWIAAEQTTLKRLPPVIANMLARQLNPTYKVPGDENGGANGGGGTIAGGQRPQGAGQRSGNGAAPAAASSPATARQGGGQWAGGQRGSGGQSGPGGFGYTGGGPPDIARMLERMPNFTLAELKPGDALIVNSAQGQDATRLTAITILAGVEPILVAAPRTFGQASGIASWNLDMQMPGQ